MERELHPEKGMLNILKNLFGQRQRSGWFGRNAHMLGGRRGGIALGTIATIAAPFIFRKVKARLAQRSAEPAALGAR